MSDENYQEEEPRHQVRPGLSVPRFDLDVSAPFWPRSFAVNLALVGVAVSVVMTPLNLILLFLSWGVLATLFGGRFADNSGPLLFLLAFVLNLAVYLLLGVPVFFGLRNATLRKRILGVVALTVVHGGVWLGWTVRLVMEWERTNRWP